MKRQAEPGTPAGRLRPLSPRAPRGGSVAFGWVLIALGWSDRALPPQVAQRQAAAAAAGGSAKYKPPKLKRWYEKVWKACRKVVIHTLVVAAVVAVMYLILSNLGSSPKQPARSPKQRKG